MSLADKDANGASLSRDSIATSRRETGARTLLQEGRASGNLGWLFVGPALLMYGFFVLVPMTMTLYYSLISWDGIGQAKWVGLRNYLRVLTDPDLLTIIGNAFQLVIYFTIIPVTLGLLVASFIRSQMAGPLGTVTRTVLFLPQVIPLAAAGIAWTWMFASTGVVNQFLGWVGMDWFARGWLGDFDFALPAVGMIGAWVLIGLCTMLLVTGITKIDPSLYEAARLDGAGYWQELLYITLPSLKQELGVCITITMIAALASFDIVYVATSGGPGISTTVPGLEIYRLAFSRREIGLASALAVVLMVLVIACIIPIQRLTKDSK